jgi:hypothetical protein
MIIVNNIDTFICLILVISLNLILKSLECGPFIIGFISPITADDFQFIPFNFHNSHSANTIVA